MSDVCTCRIRTADACIRLEVTKKTTWRELKQMLCQTEDEQELIRVTLWTDPQRSQSVLSHTMSGIDHSTLGDRPWCSRRSTLPSESTISKKAYASISITPKMPVDCSHSSSARCNLCIGRQPTQILRSETAFEQFQHAYRDIVIPNQISDARGELRYGEIDFWSFACLLEDVNPQPGEMFLDIGSGTGKAVYATRLLYPTLGLCVGIEIQRPLHDLALQIVSKWPISSSSTASVGFAHADLRHEMCDIMHSNGLITNSWPIYGRCHIVYIASTAFSDELMKILSVRLRKLCKGARVITLTRPLYDHPPNAFRLLKEQLYRFGWGNNVTVFIYERL